MALIAEITDQGILRVKSSTFKAGDEVILEPSEGKVRNPEKGNWSDMEKAFEEIDQLDFPRRTHEEIIRDIHEIRED